MPAGQAEQPQFSFHSDILYCCSMGVTRLSQASWEMYFSPSRLCPAVSPQMIMSGTEHIQSREHGGTLSCKGPKPAKGLLKLRYSNSAVLKSSHTAVSSLCKLPTLIDFSRAYIFWELNYWDHISPILAFPHCSSGYNWISDLSQQTADRVGALPLEACMTLSG